jgi:hypothetical protein
VSADGERFAEALVPAAPPLAAEADLVAEGAVVDGGARIPVPRAARTWLERVGAMLVRGEVVLFDYVDTASSLAARGASVVDAHLPCAPARWRPARGARDAGHHL